MKDDQLNDNAEIIKALKLPKDLSEKRILEIGSEESFLCQEVKKRGALRVTKADYDQRNLQSVKTLDSDIKLIDLNHENLPDEQFDIIIYRAVLRYSDQLEHFFKGIYNCLSAKGLFILECGLKNSDSMQLFKLGEGDNAQVYLTRGLLIHSYLSNFAVRYEGTGIKLPGEEMGRYVFHCRKRQPLIMLVRGDGNAGKTVLSNELVVGKKVQYIKTDGIIALIGTGKKKSLVVEDYIAKKYVEYSSSIRRVVDDLDQDESMSIDFAEIIYQKISLDERLIVIEGYALTNKVVEYLLHRLAGTAFVWEVNRAIRD